MEEIHRAEFRMVPLEVPIFLRMCPHRASANDTNHRVLLMKASLSGDFIQASLYGHD